MLAMASPRKRTPLKKLIKQPVITDENGKPVSRSHFPLKPAIRAATGRPPEYKPEYCDELIKHMGEGFSFETFAAILNTTPRTIYTWLDNYPEFLQAKETGLVKCRMWWESIGKNHVVENHISGVGVTKVNYGIWNRNMSVRFKDWREEKEQVTVNNNIQINNLSDDQLEKMVLEYFGEKALEAKKGEE